MSRDFIRIGVIGCGYIAQADHLPAATRLPNCRLVAVADASEERARRAAEVFGAERWFADYRDLLALEDVDAVDICTPHYPVDLHFPIGMDAVAAGKHVLVEKPMCNRAEDAWQLVDACRNAGVMLMVACPHRFEAEAQKAKALIEAGEIGELVGVQSLCSGAGGAVYTRVDEWFPGLPATESVRSTAENPEFNMNGGSWLHHLNVIRYLIGDPQTVLSASYDRGVHMALRYPNGAVVVHQALGRTANKLAHLMVFGTKGHLEINLSKPHFPYGEAYLRLGQRRTVTGEESVTIQEVVVPHVNSFDREVEHFADCVLHGRESISTGEDGARDLEIADATLRSWREGGRVEIAYRDPSTFL